MGSEMCIRDREINDSFAATELTLTQDELAMLNASVDARRG